MTQKYIRTRRTTLATEIFVLQTKLVRLQASCKHPAVTKEPGADTGNYDPGMDRYWYDCKCPDCGKIWTEPQ